MLSEPPLSRQMVGILWLATMISLYGYGTCKPDRKSVSLMNPIQTHAIAYAPDGKTVLIADQGDGSILRLWNVQSGQKIREFSGT